MPSLCGPTHPQLAPNRGRAASHTGYRDRSTVARDGSHAGTEVSPLVLSVTGFDDKGVAPEDPAVRQAVDQLLKRKGRLKVEDVAFTIFPQRIWEMSRGDRARLFTLYRTTFPRWQAMPWTGNAVLTTYKFTNSYRASDWASQYLIRHVIYRADLPNSPREVFRTAMI
jgi:hypothetical protein